ncbi:hypothetical protein RclHR1_14610006 [Rhizophagus clarus]|uniref:Uncharacterized protein n=1 Tax=Rhizophagus clarus TaxID=94130 RepID=A0A2Z6QHH1_9GLOM|nr:hypothetical protein RclHR1_14610006 [Rhizophagus clarus]
MLTGKDLDDVDVKLEIQHFLLKYRNTKLRKLSRCDKDSEHREKLLSGLSPTNQDEVKSWGMYLPLDEMIERLEMLELLSEY